MKTIKIVKTLQRVLSDTEIYDIITKSDIRVPEVVSKLAYLYRLQKQYENRAVPPTIPEALLSLLSIYNSIIYIHGESGYNVTFAKPVKYVNVDDANTGPRPKLSTSLSVVGVMINPTIPYLDITIEDCTLSNREANAQSIINTFASIVKQDLIDMNFQTIYQEDKELYYIITNDINIYIQLYLILYYLEDRNLFIIKHTQMRDLDIMIDLVLHLKQHLVGFAKLLNVNTEYNDVIYQIAFSKDYYELYSQYLSGSEIVLPEYPPPKPLPDIYHDFLMRYIFIREYGLAEYKNTGIIELENRYGYDLKGNIYGDIIFGQLLSDEVRNRIEGFIKAYELVSTNYPWQDVANKLATAIDPRYAALLLSELLTYVHEYGDYLLDKYGNRIICSHLYTAYSNADVGTAEYEQLMDNYKIKSGNLYVCKICGEMIDTVDVFTMDYEDIYTVYVQNANKDEIKMIYGKVSGILRRTSDLSEKVFNAVVDKITYFIYNATRSISDELSRNKILTDMEKDEHMRVYATIYSYAAIFRISNELSKTGTIIETLYSGKKIAAMLDTIISDVMRECGALIKKYKIFTDKAIRLILLNAYKDINPSGIDYGESIHGNRMVGLIERQTHRYKYSMPRERDVIDTVMAGISYINMRALTDIFQYDKVASNNAYVMLGDNINPVFISAADKEIYNFDADVSQMYFADYPRFLSEHIKSDNYFYRKPASDMDIEYIRGEHGKHQFGGIRPFKDPNSSICKICHFDYMNKPTNGFAIMENWILSTSIEFFYKKYSKICLRPTLEQLKSGDVTHIFKNNICVNCGYVKDSKDIEFYAEYKAPDIIMAQPEIIYYVPPTLNDFVKNWQYDNFLHIKLIDHCKFDMINRDQAINWLHNLGMEGELDRNEIFAKQSEAKVVRFDILFAYIMQIHNILIAVANHINTKDEAVKAFMIEHPNIKADISADENVDISSLMPLIKDKDNYLHNYIMRTLLKLNPALAKFILEKIYETSMSIVRYSDSDLYKALTNVQTKDIQYDEYADEDFNPFADVDYNGENDEGAFD